MSDARGQAHALTVLAAVEAGAEPSLRDALGRLNQGGASPLARLETTHFARFVEIPELVYGAPPQKPDRLRSRYLLFTATFDGPDPAFVEALRTKTGAEADAIWGHCEGYPGAADRPGFEHWIARHRLRTGLFVAAYPDATVARVRRALDLQRRLVEFAQRSRALEPAALQSAFREAFGPGG